LEKENNAEQNIRKLILCFIVEKIIEHNCISEQTNTRLNSFILYNKTHEELR
jgi:hypothetical protein